MERLERGTHPVGAKPAIGWLADHAGQLGMVTVEGPCAGGGAAVEIANPATGVVLARITQAGASDIANAIAGARGAQAGWAALPGFARAGALRAFGAALKAELDLLAVLRSLETGLPWRVTRGRDLPRALDHLHAAARAAEGGRAPGTGRQALGVVGLLSDPLDGPEDWLARAAPALAAGNAAVLHTPPGAALAAFCVAGLARAAGLPGGVFCVLCCEADALATAEGVICPDTPAPGPASGLTIVHADADLDSAVAALDDTLWATGGQKAADATRLLVQEGVAEAFHSRLRDRMARLCPGDPLDQGTDLGPLAHAGALDEFCDVARDEGAEVYRAALPLPETGRYHAPVLLTGLAPAAAAMQSGIRGPVLRSMTFRTLGEAIALAGGMQPARNAWVWSECGATAQTTALALAARKVVVNDGLGSIMPEEPAAFTRPDGMPDVPSGPPAAGTGDGAAASAAARAAQPGWAALDAGARADRLAACAEALAASDPDAAARLCAGAALATMPPSAALLAPGGGLALEIARPHGVIGAILGSDTSAADIASLVAIAAGCGNGLVVSVSSEGPQALSSAIMRGLPEGLVQLLPLTPGRLAAARGLDALWCFCPDADAQTRECATWCADASALRDDAELMRRANRRQRLWLPGG
ncbi:aldehyde dehydrogenase family protein [Maritimibacter sp. 55A14]|uniref:aldehyde dehydrogenase family protein n=1 Tax=Maritimibacter sp. 55A14 TaxID=2174844 RepID=UPI0013048367|nr:aldehyde dehydrogenase family protein [Maritimibacter sp. 55A14]